MIVVDSHALIWWVNGQSDELPRIANRALDDADTVGIAAITCWEIAVLAIRKRIDIHGDVNEWLAAVTSTPGIIVLPLTVEIAVRAAELRDLLRDPADCLITATASIHNAPLVTKDDRIRASGLVETIW